VFDPDALLDALPRTQIALLPLGTVVPRRRSFGDLSDYNGFTGKERMRTFGVAKWLMEVGAMPRPQTCGICTGPADQSHAENYYDLSTWIDVCRSCHGRLHRRFASPGRWSEHLDRCALAASHWTRLVSPEPFDLAGLLRQRGVVEPTYTSFVEVGTADEGKSNPSSR
jgi:hypothetical protein